MPRWNGPVLTLAQIIKFVIPSASEAELGGIFITAQDMVSTRKMLEEMRCPQPKSTIQTENSATAGVANNTIVPRKLKTMGRRIHWLRCREAQGQFRYYWASGSLDWGNYSTKHHPPSLLLIEKNAIYGNSNEHLRHLVPVGSSKCVLFQVQLEHTSTWNHNMPCTTGKA